MLRELLSDQSKAKEHHDQSSAGDGAKKEDEEFVDINHEDAQQDRPPTKEESHDDEANWEDEEEEGGFSPISAFFGAGRRQAQRKTPSKRDEVHPYTAVLSLSNLESCIELENSAFSEMERCSREKVSHEHSPFRHVYLRSVLFILRLWNAHVTYLTTCTSLRAWLERSRVYEDSLLVVRTLHSKLDGDDGLLQSPSNTSVVPLPFNKMPGTLFWNLLKSATI